MSVKIRHIATANPPLYMTQAEAYDFLVANFEIEPAEHDMYRRLLLEGPVRGRYVGADSPQELCETRQDKLIDRYLHQARRLCAEVGREALSGSSSGAAIVPEAVIVNSCTGYLCPGLSSYLAEDLDLPRDVRTLDLMGMGCGGAMPNLHLASTMARCAPGRAVLSVSVEICSATLFMGADPALIVSNSIFGDGAAAALVEAADGPAGDAGNGADAGDGADRKADGHAKVRPVLVEMVSGVYPQYREELRYRSEGGRLRNVLTRLVPPIAARTAQDVTRRLLKQCGLGMSDINWWIVHPAGTLVLDHVAEKLELPQQALAESHGVFRDYGNMSSPSVLFVLRRLMDSGRVRQGQRGLMLAFGAGFTAYAGLLEFVTD